MKSNVVLQPVISEKSYALANAENKYTFLVDTKSSKIEVAKEIESRYKVKVVSVNTTVKPGKMKRDLVSYKKFRRNDMKKAVIKLKKGDKIEEFLNI